MKSEEYIQLYDKYLSGLCTAEEERRLFEYKDGFRMYEDDISPEDKVLRTHIYHRIRKEIFVKKSTVFRLWWRYAAAILLIVSAGAVFYWNMKPEEPQLVHQVKPMPDSVPIVDSNSVTLTLANGDVLSLDSFGNGILSGYGSARISKVADGELVYKHDNHFTIGQAPINKLYVPKGGQYKLTLADGTAVWLNSNSRLDYPVRFDGKERVVELSGEAYFEVAKNDKQPFIVKTKSSKIEVLGTHFNVSAYSDEDLEKTTLMEGAVKVMSGEEAVVLKPGEQGVVNKGNEGIQVKQADVGQILAWKEGFFIFKNEHIQDVMKQISRWYNVEVEYQSIPEGNFIGGIYAKSKDLEELLKGLELTGMVRFEVEGRRVVVMD